MKMVKIVFHSRSDLFYFCCIYLINSVRYVFFVLLISVVGVLLPAVLVDHLPAAGDGSEQDRLQQISGAIRIPTL